MGKEIELEIVSCDICGNNAGDLEYVVSDYGSALNVPFYYLIRCSSCGLVYLNPRPPFGMIDKFYPSEYYSLSPLRPNQLSTKELLRRMAINGRDNNNVGLDKLLYLLIRNKLRFIDVNGNGKFLDVGCGSGRWLEVNRDYGWDVHGVEINGVAVRDAQSLGLKVSHGSISDADYPDNYFDIVAMNNVLEHTHSPRVTLQEAHRILNSSGELHIWVPNYGSYERKIFGRFWRALDAPRHLYHFTNQTLSRLLDVTGFAIEKKSNTMAFEHRASLEWYQRYAPVLSTRKLQIVKMILSSYGQRAFRVGLLGLVGILDAPYLYVIAHKA